MALHRDIFWVGKQWAVTGYGMQAVDQKQKSKFDIEASRLWEDDLLDVLSAQRWFNADDFNAGLSVARAQYPETPGKAASRKKAAVKESAPAPVAPSKPTPKVEAKAAPKPESKAAPKAEPKAEPPKPDAKAKAAKSQPAAEAAKPASKGVGPKPEAARPEAAPAPSKLAFTGGTTKSTLKIDAEAKPRKRPPAQFNIRIERWPAKFTRMWRVRVNPQ